MHTELIFVIAIIAISYKNQKAQWNNILFHAIQFRTHMLQYEIWFSAYS